MCVCVCVCVRARACVCVFMCVYAKWRTNNRLKTVGSIKKCLKVAHYRSINQKEI